MNLLQQVDDLLESTKPLMAEFETLTDLNKSKPDVANVGRLLQVQMSLIMIYMQVISTQAQLLRMADEALRLATTEKT